MDLYLFIVRSAEGDALMVDEFNLDSKQNYFAMAHDLMFATDTLYGTEVSHHCEIWEKSDHSHMNLLVTVF